MASPIAVLDAPAQAVTDDDFELDMRVVEATTWSNAAEPRRPAPPRRARVVECRPRRRAARRWPASTLFRSRG